MLEITDPDIITARIIVDNIDRLKLMKLLINELSRDNLQEVKPAIQEQIDSMLFNHIQITQMTTVDARGKIIPRNDKKAQN